MGEAEIGTARPFYIGICRPINIPTALLLRNSAEGQRRGLRTRSYIGRPYKRYIRQCLCEKLSLAGENPACPKADYCAGGVMQSNYGKSLSRFELFLE